MRNALKSPRLYSALLVLLALSAFARPARAVVTIEYLVLAQFYVAAHPVNGSLQLDSNPANLFTPTSSPIQDVGAEFTYSALGFGVSADFSFVSPVDITLPPAANPVKLALSITNPDARPFQLTFTNDFLAGAQLGNVLDPNTLPAGVTSSLVNSTLTVSFGPLPQAGVGGPSVPLPLAVWAGLAMGGAVTARRLRPRRR